MSIANVLKVLGVRREIAHVRFGVTAGALQSRFHRHLGRDQYENFREDVIPAFTVLAYPTRELFPWHKMSSSIVGKPNYWGEPKDTPRTVHGNPCYGHRVISYRGSFRRFADAGRALDPPSPSPKRYFDLGRAVARVCAQMPYRIALCASSSWSHAFMVDKTWRLNPDIAGDRKLYDAMVRGDLASWRDVPLAQIEASGQQEMLNWFCLMGAMHELGRRVEWSDFVETHIFNSDKVTAIFNA